MASEYGINICLCYYGADEYVNYSHFMFWLYLFSLVLANPSRREPYRLYSESRIFVLAINGRKEFSFQQEFWLMSYIVIIIVSRTWYRLRSSRRLRADDKWMVAAGVGIALLFNSFKNGGQDSFPYQKSSNYFITLDRGGLPSYGQPARHHCVWRRPPL